jgi:bifunctional UDP-N-acetylglucosamine pyrophosphorylase/glucosamine-1-phosphate N-acetyltransferase
MRDLRAIVLAAGKGTRMKSEVPKVLQPICGEPMIHYVLKVVKAVGSLKTYVVLGHKMGTVKQALPENLVVVPQKNQNGTAAAVQCVEKELKNYAGHVLILCGDTPLLDKKVIKSLVQKHKKKKAACTFLSAVVHHPQGYGRVIRDLSGTAAAIREDKDASGLEKSIAEINVGVYCFQSKVLFQLLKEIKKNKKKKEFYLTDIIEILYERKQKIETVETNNAIEGLGINTQEELSQAESIIRKKILKEFMEQGVRIIDPNTTFIDAKVKIGPDTVIRPFTVIEKGVRIGRKCTIGPFAHLRSETKIGNHIEVGNFTELVRTRVADGCFMKHFSYLGDSQVGANVNIGAGTVVANFDGKQKHVTRIAKDAFIGSDSVLISPVKIGEKAVIGAGSVVTKGSVIPSGGIVAGVPAKTMARRAKK